MKAAAVFALMCALVPPSRQAVNGEAEEQARERYDSIARSIADVAGNDDRLALFLVAVARHESAFVRDVHSGKVRGDDGQSYGLYQKLVSREPSQRIPLTPWRAHHIIGLSERATLRATSLAAADLAPLIDGCRGEAMCVFKRYGGIKGEPRKAATLKRLRARVQTIGRLRSLMARKVAKR